MRDYFLVIYMISLERILYKNKTEYFVSRNIFNWQKKYITAVIINSILDILQHASSNLNTYNEHNLYLYLDIPFRGLNFYNKKNQYLFLSKIIFDNTFKF